MQMHSHLVALKHFVACLIFIDCCFSPIEILALRSRPCTVMQKRLILEPVYESIDDM